MKFENVLRLHSRNSSILCIREIKFWQNLTFLCVLSRFLNKATITEKWSFSTTKKHEKAFFTNQVSSSISIATTKIIFLIHSMFIFFNTLADLRNFLLVKSFLLCGKFRNYNLAKVQQKCLNAKSRKFPPAKFSSREVFFF